jgi:hypothetical protein
MINITDKEFKLFRAACPKCNNSLFPTRLEANYDRYCKKCNYRAAFYLDTSKRTTFLNYEQIYGTREHGIKTVLVRIDYTEQAAIITVLNKGLFIPSSLDRESREEYKMPLKDEYFDDNCLIRMDALDEIVTRFKKLGIMR